MQRSIWRFDDLDCYVELSGELFEKMRLIGKKHFPYETGGTLVGYYSDNNHRATITDILGVKKGGKYGMNYFYRPSDYIDDTLIKIQERTEGKIFYLGEWHTHPHCSSNPSRKDIAALSKIGQSKLVAIDNPILLILGGNLDHANCLLLHTPDRILIGVDITDHDG